MPGPSSKPKTSASSSNTSKTSASSSNTSKTKKPFRGEDYEARLLANRMWYQNPEHKLWKKKYNANYYRANIEYWNNYYRTQKKRTDAAQRRADALRSTSYKLETLDDRQQAYEDARDARVKQQAINLARQEAIKEYNFYMQTHKKMKVTEAWSVGTKQIREAGKKFMDKLYDKIIGDEYTR